MKRGGFVGVSRKTEKRGFCRARGKGGTGAVWGQARSWQRVLPHPNQPKGKR